MAQEIQASAGPAVQTIGGSESGITDGTEPQSSGPLSTETPPETTLEIVSAGNTAAHQSISENSTPRLRQTRSVRRCLPRFRRAKHSRRPRLALQDRDVELLRTAHEYRLISTPQYLRLFSSESRDGVYARLQKLFHHGYLDRIGENPNAPLVYALGPRGAEVLEVSRRKEVGDRYLAHQLMIGDFRIALRLASRAAGVEVSWRSFPEGEPVRPDGFFGLRFPWLPDGRNRAFFFLEADRSTMPRERFLAKLRTYQAWQETGGHTAALGIKSFRILTVTKSVERMKSLLLATAGDPRLGSRLSAFWFTMLYSASTVCSAGVLGSVWHTAIDPERCAALLP